MGQAKSRATLTERLERGDERGPWFAGQYAVA